ncbi:MAG: proline--tRNA ligase [Clostridia bacterium]|nr:proline--tRNA ligase [Clostridia bacterium]
MLMSNLFGKTLRDKPASANLISHIFLLRGGYIRNVCSGIYSYLLPAIKIQKKIEAIIREEMNRIDGQEILMPVTLPAELWEESGRLKTIGSELLRFKDRTDRDMVLAMTHEEAVVHLAKAEAKSYSDYPFMLYQIQTKFRDEPRARGGLIRVREFTMKDAYSFHTSQEDLEGYYEKVLKAYEAIYKKVGLNNVAAICSDSGMMGGKVAHEFMYLSEAGEDSIAFCDNCGYKANVEVATADIEKAEGHEQDLEKIHTPGVDTIEKLAHFFNVNTSQTIKAVVFKAKGSPKPVVVFIRGDLQVNEAKLRSILKAEVQELNDLAEFNLIKGAVGPEKSFEDEFNVIYDISLSGEKNLICGANEKDCHLKGFCLQRDIGEVAFHDVFKVDSDHKCKQCGESLIIRRGIEVGNIFQLGDKYTKSMGMHYITKEGSTATPIMGCYGIGIGRLLACVIEENHDDFGPIWPKNIAPWQIHICALDIANAQVKSASLALYEKLSEKYDVLLDDRDFSAGVQFKDADLLGVPVRVIISKRNLSEDLFEVKLRDEENGKKMDLDGLLNFLSDYWH